MASDDNILTRDQHDINDPIDRDEEVKTPEDQDDDFIEGAEKDTDLDWLEKQATGDEDNLPIDKKVREIEITREKGFTKKEEKKHSK